jgi:hypothetical protein
MTHQIKKGPEGAGPSHKHNEQKYPITDGGWRAALFSLPEINEIIGIIKRDDSRLDQQRQAIMWLYQLISEALHTCSLAFLEASDEAVMLAFLDSVDALAVAPIFDDDTAPYHDALRTSREVVRLMVTLCSAQGGRHD